MFDGLWNVATIVYATGMLVTALAVAGTRASGRLNAYSRAFDVIAILLWPASWLVGLGVLLYEKTDRFDGPYYGEILVQYANDEGNDDEHTVYTRFWRNTRAAHREARKIMFGAVNDGMIVSHEDGTEEIIPPDVIFSIRAQVHEAGATSGARND